MATKTTTKKPAVKPQSRGMMSSSMGEDKKWQAQCDMRTLREAQEIQSSKPRLAAAKKEAVEQVKALQAVTKTK